MSLLEFLKFFDIMHSMMEGTLIRTSHISAISLSDSTSHPLNNIFVMLGLKSRSCRIMLGLRSA